MGIIDCAIAKPSKQESMDDITELRHVRSVCNKESIKFQKNAGLRQRDMSKRSQQTIYLMSAKLAAGYEIEGDVLRT